MGGQPPHTPVEDNAESAANSAASGAAAAGQQIRVRGLVQGVGFRPFVWRLARQCKLTGYVLNDGGGVLIHAGGAAGQIERFLHLLREEVPPLARIDDVECTALDHVPPGQDFVIHSSGAGAVQTGIVPDAATCPACRDEINNPDDRHYRYAFTNCTHCGPRLSIIRAIPYDRANTAMAPFHMCPACQAEYEQPADRRFHAQPNACPDCGPQLWLEGPDGARLEPDSALDESDVIKTVQRLLAQGHIVAVKGIGGFHLAVDGANGRAVDRLRRAKHRYDKPFALMAGDCAMIGEYAVLGDEAEALLNCPAAPIVLLDIRPDGRALPEAIAPGQNSLGFMLPYTPLHHLLLAGRDAPLVMTSGNISDEPQCISNQAARRQLSDIADTFLMHDREIVNRLDDSVVRIADGQLATLRRARGYAPSPIALPAGFADAPRVLAMGAELKNTFCLIRPGEAIVSQHMGDLQDAATHAEYRGSIELYRDLFQFAPQMIAVDMHPAYHSTQWGAGLAAEAGLPLHEVQHHHAHIASAMAEHDMPLDHGPVLGIALDGLGYGPGGELWGGEFLLADYSGFQRLAHFLPVALPGGDKAMQEPWRNAFAHLHAALGWAEVEAEHAELDIVRHMNGKPAATLIRMIESGLNAPPASSAGRLFDAAAAVIGIRPDRVSYEGQAAIEMEALAAGQDLESAGQYGDDLRLGADGMISLHWEALWRGLLADVRRGTAAGLMAARFHNTVSASVGQAALRCVEIHPVAAIVLTGGVFQNRLLLQSVSRYLSAEGLNVLSPSRFPANDGGVALGQAVITAARQLKGMI